ncbi:hypothetical protein DFH08DRAFT_915798 [Mycena albidolilacea]|uniref:ATP-dependent DNA helicase n=1 Tax=Mycena albidolilacea TaxID=1033008 RepID=A0AAD6ZTY3_9AGAR|nr:hypothetical protein DFH08DRAFT_915798 [Mycena albidolilacea]
MLGKLFLARLSRNISIGKGGLSTQSFGGINVIICGDFHQFSPVAVRPSEALFYPIDAAWDSLESKLGWTIYEEFSTVVILKEQMRVTDAVWLDFLHHLRVGGVQKHHLVMLRTLIVGKECDVESANFEIPPWLVTPRHAVRAQWNSAAVRKMCKDTGHRLFICSAEDTYQGRPLNLPEKKNGRREMKMKDLPNFIKLAIGMKVLVTRNIETDLNLANGAHGEIADVVLDPDEPPFGDTGETIVDLEKMPAYTLVKLARTRATRLEGLDEHSKNIGLRESPETSEEIADEAEDSE